MIGVVYPQKKVGGYGTIVSRPVGSSVGEGELNRGFRGIVLWRVMSPGNAFTSTTNLSILADAVIEDYMAPVPTRGACAERSRTFTEMRKGSSDKVKYRNNAIEA